MAPRIDWDAEMERIELAAARAPRRRRRRAVLPPDVVARIQAEADREYQAWFKDMDRAIGRLLARIDRPGRRR